MSVPRIRLETVEAIARKILMEYDSSLLSGEPRPIPIEAIIEVKFDLILEYHILRKNGAVLGETIFDDGPVILYDMDERSYKIIAVRKGTILIDERLCETRSIGRLRFTCAHELAHWVLHKNLYSGTGNIAAYNGQCSTDESDGVIERQADALATALLMPLPQIKKCFYRLRSGRTMEQIVAEMAQIFEVSKQATVDLELGVDLPFHLIDRLEQMFQALGGQILRLDGDYDPVGGGQGIDREHTQGRLAVNQDMGILSLERVQILPQDGLTAHGVHQGDLHAGELDVGRHQVNAFRVVQDALAGAHRLVHQDTTHRVGQSKGQLVRLGMAQADGQAALRVSVDQQNFLPRLRQPDTQICAGGCLANAAFLVGDGDNLCVHFSFLLCLEQKMECKEGKLPPWVFLKSRTFRHPFDLGFIYHGSVPDTPIACDAFNARTVAKCKFSPCPWIVASSYQALYRR